MSLHLPRRAVGVLLSGTFLAATVTACAPTEPTNVVIVLGARSNVAVPTYAGAIQEAAESVADTGGRLSIVVADGDPAEDYANQLERAGGTSASRQQVMAANLKEFVNAFEGIQSSSPESDLLGSIDVAAKALRALEGSKTIVLADSAISTAGLLQLQSANLLDQDPNRVADEINAQDGLMDLGGITVRLALAATAAPQPALPSRTARRLEALLTAILEAFHADVVSDTAAKGEPRPGLPPVTPVPIDALEPITLDAAAEPGDLVAVMRDESVAFLPNSAVLADETSARAALHEVAAAAISHGWELDVVGTTATADTAEERLATSRARAEVAAGILREEGATVASVAGVGSDFPEKVPDLRPDGSLDPEAARLNRSVRVRVADTSS